jgi:hypothetical protein
MRPLPKLFLLTTLAVSALWATHSLEATVVINEVDYDQPSTDAAEFIELKNTGTTPVDLTGWSLELVNGTGGGAAQYQLFALPSVVLAAGGYFVVCANSANTINCDLDVSPNTNLIQNGAPDGMALWNGSVLVDALSYEGDCAAPYVETSGGGLSDSGSNDLQSISRFPDGTDTNVNNVDFSRRCITPGSANLEASDNCDEPVQTVDSTWGSVKAIYR